MLHQRHTLNTCDDEESVLYKPVKMEQKNCRCQLSLLMKAKPPIVLQTMKCPISSQKQLHSLPPVPTKNHKKQKPRPQAARPSEPRSAAGRGRQVNTCTIQHTTLHSSPGHTKQNSKGVDELLRKTIFHMKFGYLSHRPQNLHK